MRAMALCGTDGKPHDVRVARALGYGLDEKAVQAVKVWRFEPAMKDGQPVAAQINVTVSFRLWSMSVSPKSAQLAPEQPNNSMPSMSDSPNSAMHWTVSGPGCAGSVCGSITDDGLYTAPLSVPTPATVIVTAISAADPMKKASSKVTIHASPSP